VLLQLLQLVLVVHQVMQAAALLQGGHEADSKGAAVQQLQEKGVQGARQC
jgi:hypothetical protein